MEGVGRIAAVGSGIGERSDDVEEVVDGARLAVGDDQRCGVRFGRAGV
jgi:hypothetical protein